MCGCARGRVSVGAGVWVSAWVSFGAGVGVGVCERGGVGGRRAAGGRVDAGASRRGSGFWHVCGRGRVGREVLSFSFF